MTPKERAEKAAAAMWADDAASRAFGMQISDVDAGHAILTLTVTPDQCNGHGTCHGGVTYALADSAFAFACNSHNQRSVAQHNSITYIAPAQAGDQLIATAREISRSGRSGIYDVRVTTTDDRVIAEFRGHSRTIKGQLFEEPTP